MAKRKEKDARIRKELLKNIRKALGRKSGVPFLLMPSEQKAVLEVLEEYLEGDAGNE